MYCIRSATSYLFSASLGDYFMNFFERWYFSLLNIIIEWLSLYSLHCKFAPQSSSQHWQIFCKNVNNTFQIENSGNSKTDFFLKPILANISVELCLVWWNSWSMILRVTLLNKCRGLPIYIQAHDITNVVKVSYCFLEKKFTTILVKLGV